MTNLGFIIIYSLLSGSTIFLGGVLSHYFSDHVKSGRIKSEVIHVSIAFGGGILLATVALVLVPKGMESLPFTFMILCFSAGAISFLFLNRFMAKKEGGMAQLLGMVSDFIPQTVAMGAVFVKNPKLGILLALIIGIQNLPEAFNAYMDLKENYSSRKCLVILFSLSFSGIGFTLLGFYFLSGQPMIIGGLMLFSAGGLIYLIFQEIIPMSKVKKKWIPALGGSLGYLVGMIAVKIIN